MTKFEEILRKIKPRKKFLEFNAGITYWYCLSDLIQKFGNWHSDEEFQIVEEIGGSFALANKNLIDANTKLTEAIADLKSRLQQQALPVVPEYVGEFVSGDETELSKADRIAYLLKSVQGDSYYLTEKLPGDGTITVDEGQELYNWAICQYHETILELWNGYTVEKPQLFYLKNKLTTSYLILDTSTGYFEHWGSTEATGRYKSSFTQQEIGSMETGSYEQIEVAE